MTPKTISTKETTLFFLQASQVVLVVKNPPTNAGDVRQWVRPSREDPLEKGTAAHFSILAWRIPWTEELGGLHFIGSQRI